MSRTIASLFCTRSRTSTHASACPSWMARSSRISASENPRALARFTNARRSTVHFLEFSVTGYGSAWRSKQAFLLVKAHGFEVNLSAFRKLTSCQSFHNPSLNPVGAYRVKQFHKLAVDKARRNPWPIFKDVADKRPPAVLSPTIVARLFSRLQGNDHFRGARRCHDGWAALALTRRCKLVFGSL